MLMHWPWFECYADKLVIWIPTVYYSFKIPNLSYTVPNNRGRGMAAIPKTITNLKTFISGSMMMQHLIKFYFEIFPRMDGSKGWPWNGDPSLSQALRRRVSSWNKIKTRFNTSGIWLTGIYPQLFGSFNFIWDLNIVSFFFFLFSISARQGSPTCAILYITLLFHSRAYLYGRVKNKRDNEMLRHSLATLEGE